MGIREEHAYEERRKAEQRELVKDKARAEVEKLVKKHFRIEDASGRLVATKTQFAATEFAPRGEDKKPLLKHSEILDALGVSEDERVKVKLKAQAHGPHGEEIKFIWPTNIPGLSYVRIRRIGAKDIDPALRETDYFEIDKDFFEKGDKK